MAAGHREQRVRRIVEAPDVRQALMDYIQERDDRDQMVADAIHRFTDVAADFVKIVTPAAQVIADSGRRLDALCRFCRKWGIIFLWSCPIVAMLVGAITPNAAARIDQFLKLMGH